MAFERFTGTGRSYASRVSVSKAGLISFNNGATKRFRIDERPYAVLFYDAEENRMGIMLTDNAEEAGARKIRLRESGADVAAKVFFDYYGVAVDETMVYEPTLDEEGEMVIIDLGSGKPRSRGADGED